LSDLRVSSRFECRELCLVDLPAVASSDFDAAVVLSAPAAATGDGPAKHTISPAASIKAERPLALNFM
jgi:hypothetical protein